MIESLLLDISDINIKTIQVILVKRRHVQDYERRREFPKQRWKARHGSPFLKSLHCGRLREGRGAGKARRSEEETSETR